MTSSADHKGFAALGRHDPYPFRWWVPGPFEIGQLADVMDFHIRIRLLTQLTSARLEPLDQLLRRIDGDGGRTVQQGRSPLTRRLARPRSSRA